MQNKLMQIMPVAKYIACRTSAFSPSLLLPIVNPAQMLIIPKKFGNHWRSNREELAFNIDDINISSQSGGVHFSISHGSNYKINSLGRNDSFSCT
jgi:hypothetical protein